MLPLRLSNLKKPQQSPRYTISAPSWTIWTLSNSLLRHLSSLETISVPLMPSVPFLTEDITFEPIRTVQFRSGAPAHQHRLIYERCGKTVEVEDPAHQPSVSPVCVVWNHVPERLTLPRTERTVTLTFLMSVDGDAARARNELRTGKHGST